MPQFDPYTPSRHYYECLTCGTRTIAARSLDTCPSCEGPVRNIAVARE